MRFDLIDEWCECCRITEDSYLAYGGVRARESEEDPAASILRLSTVFRDHAEKNETRAKKILPQADVCFVGGELNPSQAKGFAKSIIAFVAAGLRKDGQPLPELDTALRALAARIRGERA